jgi:hypothetical protein
VIECGSYRAAVAEPYAMTYVHASAGLYVVMSGGGGGAAQLMPATELEKASDAARVVALEARGDELLTTWLDEVDASMAALRAGFMYKGSHAEATAVVVSSDTAWIGNVGLGRCYRLDAEGLVQLTRDDSLLGEAGVDRELAERYGDIVTSVLGTWRETRPDWQPTPISIDGVTGLLLASREAHRATTADELAAWSRDALATNDLLDDAAAVLWHRLHANLAPESTREITQFERRAAIMLLRIIPE